MVSLLHYSGSLANCSSIRKNIFRYIMIQHINLHIFMSTFYFHTFYNVLMLQIQFHLLLYHAISGNDRIFIKFIQIFAVII